MILDAARFLENLQEISSDIADLGPKEASLVAVTKGFDVDAIAMAYSHGVRDFGENYADELLRKAKQLKESPTAAGNDDRTDLRWHFIGQLQRNKVKQLCRKMDQGIFLWQSIDRPELADILKKEAGQADVLLQLDTTNNPDRGGVQPSEVESLCEHCQDVGLNPLGLMLIARQGEDARKDFQMTRNLADKLGLKVISMGMSQDYKIALSEGSTMVRLGTALFGNRGDL